MELLEASQVPAVLHPSLREWLPEDHLAWFVLDAVDEIDLGAFYGAYREDGWRRAAFEPRMLVALLFYACALGERSSRGIERRCREDVALRVIIAKPGSRPRDDCPLSCPRRGVVAVDGSLLAGNAAPGATRS